MILFFLVFGACALPIGAQGSMLTPPVDGLTTLSSISSDTLLESIRFYRRFQKPKEKLASGLVEKRAAQELDEKKIMDDEPVQYMGLAWMLDYTYYQATSPSAGGQPSFVDQTHTFGFGLDLRLSDRGGMAMYAGLQLMPAENYEQGIFHLRFDFLIPLNADYRLKDPRYEHIDESDATQYYMRQIQVKQAEKVPDSQNFPQILTALNFNFNRHDKGTTDSGRTAGNTLTDDVILNQASSGPELIFLSSPTFRIRASALFYYYDASVDSFVTNFSAGVNRPVEGLGLANLIGYQDVLMTFPQDSFDESFSYDTSPSTTFEFNANQSTYALTGPGMSLGFAAILRYVPSEHWQLKFGVDFTNSTNSSLTGAFGLNYLL